MDRSASSARPLAGIRVLELATAIQGPAAGQLLADFGAEVIKVEPPIGDTSRYVGRADHVGVSTGTQFLSVNRGKRSVCLDATTPLAREVLARLAANADVFLSNYRAPALAKLGLDSETLQRANPRLVYAAASGFGPLGADAEKAMIDGAAQARGGLLSVTGPSEGIATPPGAMVADTAGAMSLALAVTTALVERERTGVARRVDVSALGAQLWLQTWELQHAAVTGESPRRHGPHHHTLRGPYGVYASSDGAQFAFTVVLQVAAWRALWEFVGEPDVARDPRWDSHGKHFTVGSDADVAEIRERLRTAWARRTCGEWEAFLAAQPEIVCERARDYAEVLADPQNAANGYVAQMAIAQGRDVSTVGAIVMFDRTIRSRVASPPALGEATREVMRELGFGENEVREAEEAAAKRRRELLGS
jgi:formyl-CoA transferase/CoA:oxalate CoA-transferase